MEISIDNRNIVIDHGRSVERFAVSHIRKTQKVVRTFTYFKDNKKAKSLAMWALTASVGSCFGIASQSGGAFVVIFAVSALTLVLATWDLLTNPAYRKKDVSLYWGMFVSGDSEKYSIVARSEALVDGFLHAINDAMRDAIAQVYNVSIDNSMSSANVNIDTLINEGGGSVTFYEGEVPKEGEVRHG